jgi:pimeloyl-ACP methyl ester carboxylesterase
MTPRSWEGWIDRYQRAGYKVLAPSWPGLEGEVEAVRKDPSVLKGLKLKTVVDHYEKIIRKLDAPPILMGHSFGGLIVQMLVDRGLGAAAVLINSAQPAGVPVLPFATIRATFPILGNPFSFNSATQLTTSQFNFAFANELNEAEAKKVSDRYQIPAANGILWGAALALVNLNESSKVNFQNGNRAPILFIAGGNDHLAPAAINKANLRKYVQGSTAVADYREFPNRTHNTVGQKGWEEVADFAVQWANEHARGQVTLDDVRAAFVPERPFNAPGNPEIRA